MTSVFNRLGNLGILLIACALLLGGLAGAAVVHHYDRLAADTIAAQRGDDGKDPGRHKQHKQHKQHGNPRHPNQGHHGTADGGPVETD